MSDILLDVQHLTHCFPLPGRQTLRAVNDVSFQLKQGEILGLVGESGCGKSTVARCIMNVYRPTAGHIYYDGIDTCDAAQYRANRRRLEAERQLIFQDSTSSLNPRMTAAEIIAEPMAIHHMKPPRGSLRAEAAFQLYYVGMEESYLDKYPPELSGGQRQRATSPFRRWTCPFRPRSSICFPICGRSTGSPSCSSPMTCPWWSTCATGWGSCTGASWWSLAPPRQCSLIPGMTIPKRCCRLSRCPTLFGSASAGGWISTP